MAFDPEDLLELPYRFGECKEYSPSATVTCECFAKESIEVRPRVRRTGKWVEVCIPNILQLSKEGENIDFSTIKISSFLDTEDLGDTPRRRIFGCLARVFELETGIPKVVPAMVTVHKDGRIEINPGNKSTDMAKNGSIFSISSNYFHVTDQSSGLIGTFTFTFTYEVDDLHSFDKKIKMTKLEMEED